MNLRCGRQLILGIGLMLNVPVQAAEALVLLHGNIYTGDDAAPKAEAIVAEAGRIVYVGTSDRARELAPAAATVVDLAGSTVLPGLTDAHAHLAGIGFRELSFDLEGTTGIPDLQARIKARLAGLGPRAWLSGRGWIESRWQPAVFPGRADLDAVVLDRPVILIRADGHAAVVNSLALKLARIDRTTPNPAGGEILHDAEGEPTGMLIDNAIDLVSRMMPARTDEEIRHALLAGAEREVRLGWTQVHVAGNGMQEVVALHGLLKEKHMKLRVYAAVQGPGPAAEQLLAEGAAIDQCDGRLTVRGIKLHIDGALGSRGAALLAPYSDSLGSSGLVMHGEKELMPVLIAALRQGIQIETHAIGDRGNRLVLDLYAKAFATVPPAMRKVAEPRWRIEHAQVIAPADIPRFAALGVIASMQPSHAIGDLVFAPARLGPERLAGAYAWRSLIDAGTIIAGGSDAPVERGEPMIEFYAAVARHSLDGFAGPDWHLEQRVTREEALRMFTLWPAYAAFQEKDRGTIEVGKQADFTVLSADIMRIPEAEIPRVRCVMTIIAGERVFTDPALAASLP